MSKLDNLLKSFRRYIEIPWYREISPLQRSIFCVYTPANERKLNAKLEKFKQAAKNAHHEWLLFDLSTMFAEWLISDAYANKYFAMPYYLDAQEKLDEFIVKRFEAFIQKNGSPESGIVALWGIGTLFGFTQIHTLVAHLAPLVQGRLVVFFPGSVEANNFRLLDLHDGGNYRVVTITEND